MRVGLLFVVIFAALSLLGLQFLSASLNAAILYLPRVLLAFLLLLAGMVISEFVRRQVDRLATQMDLPGPLGGLAQAVVLAVFVVTALAQLGVPTQILLVLVSVLLAAAAATLALAFGIGGREMAREVSARRYVEGAFRVGQEITVSDVRGTIAAIEATGTVLETAGGERVRVPNSQLIAGVVRLHDARVDAGYIFGGPIPGRVVGHIAHRPRRESSTSPASPVAMSSFGGTTTANGPSSTTEQAKEKAQETAQQAKRGVRDQVDQRSTEAGERVSSMAQDARSVADELRNQGKDQPAKLAEQAAQRAESLGDYLQRSDGDTILRDVEDFGRQRPWAVIAGGLALGFAASRFLKASSSRRYESQWDSSRDLPRAADPPAGALTTGAPTTRTGARRRRTAAPAPACRRPAC